MKKLNEKEQEILQAIEKLGGRSFSKKIAETAEMNPATASKYLMSLEGKGVVNKDDSQRPHIYWEIPKKAKI
jgi:DNA-binding IclR family transcriptional regulator